MGRWRELARERSPRYRELAALRIDAGHGSPARVARAILGTLQLEPRTRPDQAAHAHQRTQSARPAQPTPLNRPEKETS